MRLVDANLLLFAHQAGAPQFERASGWLEDAFWSGEPIATSWTNVLAFMRLSTGKIFTRPFTTIEATRIVDSWFSEAGLTIVEPTERHWSVLRELLDETGLRGNLIADAHLAALALEHGATLCTDDVDFRRFKGLKLELPLRRR